MTHYHPDHVGGGFGGRNIAGLAELLAKQPVKIYTHRDEADGVRKVTGVSESDLVRVDSGDKLKVGDIEVEFLHTPGHTPGSQCFRISNTLVSGDTLFIQGCGRVDLPGSDPEQMYHSLRKLAALPDDTLLLPGSPLQRSAERDDGRNEGTEPVPSHRRPGHVEAGDGLDAGQPQTTALELRHRQHLHDIAPSRWTPASRPPCGRTSASRCSRASAVCRRNRSVIWLL